jgi:hypothetical protein
MFGASFLQQIQSIATVKMQISNEDGQCDLSNEDIVARRSDYRPLVVESTRRKGEGHPAATFAVDGPSKLIRVVGSIHAPTGMYEQGSVDPFGWLGSV